LEKEKEEKKKKPKPRKLAQPVPSLLFPVRPSPTRRGLLSPAHRARRPQPLIARLHMCIKYPWVELNYDIIFSQLSELNNSI